jgi:hypothetical protein
MNLPNFTLQASDGRTYTLADFKGRRAVVLAWFPQGVHTRLHARMQVAIQAIDKQVRPATSAEDLSAKLHDLGTPTR